MSSEGGDDRWDWPTLNAARAAALLADQLPGAGGDLIPLGDGDYCFAFRSGKRVVRVAKHAEAAAALHREACVLTAIADALPLPVPRPTFHDPGTCPPFALHDEVPGEVLTRDWWQVMTSPARARAATDLAAFLTALHEIAVETVFECRLPLLDGPSFAEKVRREAAETLYETLDDEIRRRLDELLARWSSSPPGRARRPVLLHCDIAPGHLLFDSATGRLTGVIDFGDLALGDPARDFIFIYEDYGEQMLMEVLAHYGAENLPGALPEIRKWYLLEAISWTIGMHAAGMEAEIEHGLAEITREVGALTARWIAHS